MKFRLMFSLSLLILFLGCGSSDDNSETHWNVINQEIPEADVIHSNKAEEVLAQLKQEFAGDILDDDFQTIKELTNSPTYLKFISQDVEYGSFMDYVDANIPPKHWFQELIENWIDNPEDADYLVTYYIVSNGRHGRALEYQGEPEGTADELMTETFAEPHVWAWLNGRFPDNRAFVLFTVELAIRERQLEEEDISICDGLINDFGQDDGMIMFALNYPFRLPQILNDFSDIDIFLKWTKGEFTK